MSYGFVKAHHEAILNDIVDTMVPAYGNMPSATQSDVAQVWIDEVLNVRHDLRPSFYRALRILGDNAGTDPHECLSQLQRTD